MFFSDLHHVTVTVVEINLVKNEKETNRAGLAVAMEIKMAARARRSAFLGKVANIDEGVNEDVILTKEG